MVHTDCLERRRIETANVTQLHTSGRNISVSSQTINASSRGMHCAVPQEFVYCNRLGPTMASEV